MFYKINIFVVLIILLFSSNKTFSQKYVVNAGLNAGVNLTDLVGLDKPESISKGYGFTCGLFVDVKVLKRVSFVFDFNYLQKSFGFTENTENIKIQVSESNKFLELPAQIRIRWNNNNGVGVFINSGGFVSYLIQKERDTVILINNYDIQSHIYYGYENHPIDFGLVFGTGFRYKSLSLEFRYSHSLQNLYSGINIKEMRYSTFSVFLSYNLSYIPSLNFTKNSKIQKLRYRIRNALK